ncbi:uncharacterized protein LOC131942363 [Physella acuta]|uniref:uncharacterized protein LOC131942363 n=1 Tax=Physella acuta TaxID=109671 RepID=UPI0027DC0255|nr:uncharacterized protein LOC131942363 [Physella acuta]
MEPAIPEDVSQYFIGKHEVQECLKGQSESDLHTHKINCKKNPGHTGFIPAKKFRKEHLPPGYQDSDVYDVVNGEMYVTVRITVKFTSPHRPKFVVGTQDPYPCYSSRGKRLLRTGTGKVDSVYYDKEGVNKCPCPECETSIKPKKKFAHIRVLTARHVIYDSSEASRASCRLWFDDDQSPVVNIYGWKAHGSSPTDQDWTILVCLTHDLEIPEKLLNVIRRFRDVWLKANEKYESRVEVDKLAIIVSHPHGCSKQVSVGRWVHRQEIGRYSRYTYTACTCPGSSGAPVYKLGRTDHPHSGAHASGSNYSTAMIDMDYSCGGEDLNEKRMREHKASMDGFLPY